MVAVSNIEFYLQHHPELADQREAILLKARERAEEGLLSGSDVNVVLGPEHARLLFAEINNPEHLRRFGEAIEASPLRDSAWALVQEHRPRTPPNKE